MDKLFDEFKSFLENEVEPALKELSDLKNDSSRKHIQKLVYTNLVDRMDYCLDQALSSMLDDETCELRDEILMKCSQPVNEDEILRMILAEDAKEMAIVKLREKLSNTVLRGRHSRKLKKVLILLDQKETNIYSSRVNPSTGQILSKYKM